MTTRGCLRQQSIDDYELISREMQILELESSRIRLIS